MRPLSPRHDLALRLLEQREKWGGPWHPCRALGGSPAYNLGQTMRRLHAKGLVDRKDVGKATKAHYHYRVSTKGQVYLAQHPKPPASLPATPPRERPCPSLPSS